jgi:hypothetical protein
VSDVQDAPVDELEAAIADLGASLVALEKFRAGASEADELRRQAIALGDQARRLHRRARLDAEAARALLGSVHALGDALAALLAERRTSPLYQEAVAAHGRGDALLRRILPELFIGLVAIEPPAELLHVPSWSRRGRALPPADLAGAAEALRRDGLAADGDPIARGRDPELPAVPLDEERDPAAPMSFRWRAADLPPLVFRLVDTGDVLVHVPHLTASFDAVVPQAVDGDEAADLLPDYPAYRDALRAALRAAGIPVGG